MIFTETELRGAFILDLERREDDRRFFRARLLPERVHRPRAEALIAQANIAFNKRKASFEECTFSSACCGDELVRCTRGALSTSSSTSDPKARRTSSMSPWN